MKQYDDNAERYGYEGEMTPMKCDELEEYKAWELLPEEKVYLKSEVDAAIAELKEAWRSEQEACEYLKAKLENVQASAYADSVDAGMRERRLRRTLYKACANWAIWRASVLEYFCIKINAKKWERMHHKCIAKAEEYR